MGFSFYPNHEHKCPNISHCPHLGGAALGTLVLLANEQELSRRALHSAIDAERARGDRLFAENQRLQKELDQVKLELKLDTSRSGQVSRDVLGEHFTGTRRASLRFAAARSLALGRNTSTTEQEKFPPPQP